MMHILIHFDKSVLMITEARSIPKGFIVSDQSLADTAAKMFLAKGTKRVAYKTTNLRSCWVRFRRLFLVVKAAGGLVTNPGGQYLYIFRKGKWDLPKGKLESGESSRSGAVREVTEECLVKGLKITRRLPDTFHTYAQKDTPSPHRGTLPFRGRNMVLKETHWYAMTCSDWIGMKPQRKEGITKVRWLTKKQIRAAMKNSYPSIRTLTEDCIPGIKS